MLKNIFTIRRLLSSSLPEIRSRTTYNDVVAVFGKDVKYTPRNVTSKSLLLSGTDVANDVEMVSKVTTLNGKKLTNIVTVHADGRDFYLVPPVGTDFFSYKTLRPWGNLAGPEDKPTPYPVLSPWLARYVLSVHYDNTNAEQAEYLNFVEYMEQLMCVHLSRDSASIGESTYLMKLYKTLGNQKKEDIPALFAQELFKSRVHAIKTLKDQKSTDIIKPELPNTAFLQYKQRVFLNSPTKKYDHLPEWVQKKVDAEKRIVRHNPLSWSYYAPAEKGMRIAITDPAYKKLSFKEPVTTITTFRTVTYNGGVLLSPILFDVIKQDKNYQSTAGYTSDFVPAGVEEHSNTPHH